MPQHLAFCSFIIKSFNFAWFMCFHWIGLMPHIFQSWDTITFNGWMEEVFFYMLSIKPAKTRILQFRNEVTSSCVETKWYRKLLSESEAQQMQTWKSVSTYQILQMGNCVIVYFLDANDDYVMQKSGWYSSHVNRVKVQLRMMLACWNHGGEFPEAIETPQKQFKNA